MMTTTFVTEAVGKYTDRGYYSAGFMQAALRKGRVWLRLAKIDAAGCHDLAYLAYECYWGMSSLHPHRLDEDYIVAGEVLDRFVSDHDAELLVEIVPAIAHELGGQIGGMTREVTAVHTVLLQVCGAMRERWEADDE